MTMIATRRGTATARLAALGTLTLAILAGAAGASAQTGGPAPGPGPMASGGPGGPGGPGGHGGHGGHGGGHGPMAWMSGSPEQVARSVDRMLDGLNATDAQRARIRQIATAAATDLRARRDAERELNERALQIFGAPTVDAGAAEALRQQMTQRRDEASRRVLQAMLDVANVLTPEQRATLTQRLRDRRATMRDRFERWRREAPGRPASVAPAS